MNKIANPLTITTPEDDLGHEHLVDRGTHRASGIGEAPNWTQCGLNAGVSFRIADGKIVERWRPNGHLDVAPDRRLVDLELGGADRPAGAQCAEFGQ